MDLGPDHDLVLLEVQSSRVIGDPDTKTAHGIVTVRALVDAV